MSRTYVFGLAALAGLLLGQAPALAAPLPGATLLWRGSAANTDRVEVIRADRDTVWLLQHVKPADAWLIEVDIETGTATRTPLDHSGALCAATRDPDAADKNRQAWTAVGS